MVDGLGVEATHPADVVGAPGEVGKELVVHPHPALAFLSEAVLGRCDGESLLPARHGGEALAPADAVGQVLVVPVLHHGLVVEEIHLGRTPNHVEIDDPPGLGRVVGIEVSRFGLRVAGQAAPQQVSEGGAAEDVLSLRKEIAAGEGLLVLFNEGHSVHIVGQALRLPGIELRKFLVRDGSRGGCLTITCSRLRRG